MQLKIGKDTEISSVSTTIKENRLSFVSEKKEPLLEKVEALAGNRLSPSKKRKLEIGSYLRGSEKRKWRRSSEKKKRRLMARSGGKKEIKELEKTAAPEPEKNVPKFGTSEAGKKEVTGRSAGAGGGTVAGKTVKSGIKAAKKLAKKAGERLSNGQKPNRSFGSANAKAPDEKETMGAIRNVFAAILSVIGTIVGLFLSPVLLIIVLVILVVVIVIALIASLAAVLVSAFTLNISSPFNLSGMPYYNQGDYAAYSFCDGTIASSGCGITSMAMVVSCLTQSEVEPSELAELANNSSHGKYCTVHSHSAILNIASYYGISQPEQMAGQDANCCGLQAFDYDHLVERLNAGCPVIVSGGSSSYFPSVSGSDWASSIYSANGHYVAVLGSGDNGYYLYDPGSHANYTASQQNGGTALSEILRYSKHIYIFEEAPQAAVELSGGSYAEQAFNFFVNLGYSKECAAAIVGNIWIENGNGGNNDLNIKGEYTDGYYGICAWGGNRQKALMDFAASRGETDENMSFETQLLYLYQELQDGTVWGFPSSYTGERAFPEKYNLTYEEWKNCTDVEIATGAFRACFEKCYYYNSNLNAETSLPGVIPAIDYAQSVYDQYG